VTDVIVRPAVLADVEPIAEIHAAGYEDTYRGLVPDEVIDVRTPELRRRAWRERLGEDRPREFVLVAELDGRVRGFVSGRASSAEESGSEDERVGCWENLYLDPEAIGTAAGFRIGLALQSATAARFRELGYDEAVAFVIEGNERALRFFETVGWRLDGGVRAIEGHVQHRVRRRFAPPAAVISLPGRSSQLGGAA
jgi:L-amino acid N-acyltransferase YncA